MRIAVALGLMLSVFAIQAHPGQESSREAINIPAQDLSAALQALARDRKLQVVFVSEDVAGLKTNGAVGELTAEEALVELLSGTGLGYKYLDEQTITVQPLATQKKSGSSLGASTKAASAQAFRVAQATQPDVVNAAEDEATAVSGQNAETASEGLTEVVVTAQKRVERLQDVPISVTALSEESLLRTGADKFEDYAGQVPGIHYLDAGEGRSRLNIRGVSTTQSGSFEEGQSATAVYIDDFPSMNISNPWATTDLRLFDVERIEVLRGPQGTLFGSGALGGAVRILTNKPDAKDFAAGVETVLETTDGGDASERYNGMLNIPLIQDKMAVRVVGYYRDEGGYVDNTFRGEKNVNHGDSVGGRFMLGWTPTKDLSLRYTLTHQDDSFADASRVDLDESPPYEYDGWSPSFTNVRLTLQNLVAEYDFGPVMLTSSTTYSDSFINLGQGIGQFLDGLFGWTNTPGATFGEKNIFTATTLAEELRLTSRDGTRLQWVLGAFYLDQDLGQRAHWFASTDPELFRWSIPAAAKEKALFGEASFKLLPNLTATAGARFFDYEFSRNVASASGAFAALAGVMPGPTRGVNESALTPKFAVSYKPVEDLTIYTQAAKGYRVGQPNPAGGSVDVDGFVIPSGWKSDNLWNYELGAKTVLFNRTLRLNTALFYIDWKDIPLLRFTTGSGLSFTDNAGSGTSKGLEAEIEWAPTAYLDLGSSVSFANAKLYAVSPGTSFRPGDRMPGTPEFSASNYVQLSVPVQMWQADGYLRVNHRLVGRQKDYLEDATAAWSDRYNVFDVRAGLAFDRFEAAFHVDNIANSDAVTTRSVHALYLNPQGMAYRLRPRTIGITFRAQF